MNIIYALILLYISYALRPKPPAPPNAELKDYQIPTAEEGRPVPVVFGTVTVKGANVSWYGSNYTDTTGGDDQYNHHFLCWQMIICRGPVDRVLGVYFDEKLAKAFDYKPDNDNRDASRILVNAPGLFGGRKKEGGVMGVVEICDGESDSFHPYFSRTVMRTPGSNVIPLKTEVPGYRGLLSVVFRGAFGGSASDAAGITETDGTFNQYDKLTFRSEVRDVFNGKHQASFYIGMQPVVKNVGIKVRRITTLWDGSIWYPTKAEISAPGSNDIWMNPAHIIYQVLTSTQFGMGKPTSMIDDAAFRACADTLFTEGFGLSFVWNQEESTETFIQNIMNHIAGTLNQDRFTGLYTIRLFRKQDTSGAVVLDESNTVSIDKFQRAGWGEIVNTIVVKWTDPEKESESSVTVHDLASIQSQGSAISRTVDYTAVRDRSLAARLGERDLRMLSTPLAALAITVTADAWQLRPGDIFKFSSADYGIVNGIFRVGTVDYDVLNGQLRIEAIEDVFSLSDTTYVDQEDGDWLDPVVQPDPMPVIASYDAPIEVLRGQFPETTISSFKGTECFPMFFGKAPSPKNSGFNVYYNTINDLAAMRLVASSMVSDTFLISIPLSRTVSGGVLCNFENLSTPENLIGKTIVVGDEFMYIASVNVSASTIDVYRATHDTLPREHLLNSRAWVLSSERFSLFREQSIQEDSQLDSVSSFWILPATSVAYEQDKTTMTPFGVGVTNRWFRPSAPANVRIDGQLFPSEVSGTFKLSWYCRDRGQNNHLNSWLTVTTNSLNEQGSYYFLDIFNNDNNDLLLSEQFLAVDEDGYGEIDVVLAFSINNIRLEMYSARSSRVIGDVVLPSPVLIKSYYKFVHVAGLIGYGLNYGNDYGGNKNGQIVYQGELAPFNGDIWKLTFAGSFVNSANFFVYLSILYYDKFKEIEIDCTGLSSLTEAAFQLEYALRSDSNIANLLAVIRIGNELSIQAREGTIELYAYTRGVHKIETALSVAAAPAVAGQQGLYALNFYTDAYNEVPVPSFYPGGLLTEYVKNHPELTEPGEFAIGFTTKSTVTGYTVVNYSREFLQNSAYENIFRNNAMTAINFASGSTGVTAYLSYGDNTSVRSRLILVTNSEILISSVQLSAKHANAITPVLRTIQAPRATYGSGTAQSVQIAFSLYEDTDDGLATLTVGEVFRVYLDEVPFSYTVQAGDLVYAPYFDPIYEALKTAIEATGDYTVAFTRAARPPEYPGPVADFISSMLITSTTINQPFTWRANASFGMTLTATKQ